MTRAERDAGPSGVPDANSMQTKPAVEQGWSSSSPRKLWRLMARRLSIRPFALAGPSAVATITFDDVPDSAATVGAPLLERRGVGGTFYVAANTCGRQDRHWRVCSRADVRALAAAAHEIGCHTASHVNIQSLSPAGLDAEIERNAALLAEMGADRPSNFAYPFGDLGWRQARHLVTGFRSCRTIYEQLNAGTIDLAKVSAIGLFDATMTRERLVELARQAVNAKAWLVFYTHDVADEPTFMGTSPRLMGEALDILADHGIACLTMEAALRHHGLPAP